MSRWLPLLCSAALLSACAPDAPASPSGQQAVGPAATLDGVSADLHACLPDYVQASGGRYFETARLETSDGTRVLIEQLNPDDPAEATRFRPALLRIGEAGCEPFMAGAPLSPYVLRSDLPQYDDLVAQRYVWRAGAFGGPAAFATAWAEARAPLPAVECESAGILDLEVDCVPQPDAAALRAVGVDVTPLGGRTAPVDAALLACLSDAMRAPVEAIKETARTDADSSTYVLLEWTSGADGATRTSLLRQTATGCTSLLPESTDTTIEDVVAEPVADALAEARLDGQVERAGGLDAYAEQLRERSDGRLDVCSGPDETWTDCLDPDLADRLRARGLDL